jgi:predicted amidophosphoribosyltransferase
MGLHDLRLDIADLFLGRACSGCGALGTVLCPDCRTALRPQPQVHEHLIHTGTTWLPAAHALSYRGVVRRVLYTYKDHRVPELAATLSPLLGAAIVELIDRCKAGPHTRIVPVPSRRAAVRRRGFDPVRRVLERLQPGIIDDQIIADWLIDQRGRGASKRLDRSARLHSAREAFRPARRLTPGSDVILVDDIITTGSTVSAAARTLERAGVHVRGIAAIAYTN